MIEFGIYVDVVGIYEAYHKNIYRGIRNEENCACNMITTNEDDE